MGGLGNDKLYGEAGDDPGGAGTDHLDGGDGTDVALFRQARGLQSRVDGNAEGC